MTLTLPSSPDTAPEASTLSVLGQRWRLRAPDDAAAWRGAAQSGLPELLCRVLAGRGVAAHDAEKYLRPTLREHLPDPLHLRDMDKAATRFVTALLSSHDTIAVFGDYDVDGATSSALLVRYAKALGKTMLVHIPDRIKEGYGPSDGAMTVLRAQGATVVITVDCGSMAHAPLAHAKTLGLDVIVLDHHKSDTVLPECHALVNPNRYDETSPHTQLAACGVVFLFLVAVNTKLRALGHTPPDILAWLDLVALGTICDVMPLTGVNRALVAQGLKLLRARRNTGLRILMETAKLAEAPEAYHAGFILGPRINAGGRVGQSDLGVRLLTTDDEWEARALSAQLEQFNAERKAIEAQVQEEAAAYAAALPASDAVLVVAGRGWHPGVIGIVAGRLKEHWQKPVAVIAWDEHGVGKASARSVTGVDLGVAVMQAVQEGHLLYGGGHAMAAGFTVQEANLERLRDFFNRRLGAGVAALAGERALWFDSHVALSGITLSLVDILEQAGPYGVGNPGVRVVVKNVLCLRGTVVGADHVRVILVDNQGTVSSGLKAMAFRSLNTPLGSFLLQPPRGARIAVAGTLRRNSWQSRESVDFFIDDARIE